MFRDLHHDAKLRMARRGIRAFAFSYVNVAFAIYLARLGYSTVTVGIILSLDNPLPSSLTMAMVQSQERGSAAGVTSLPRIGTCGISPTLSTYLIQGVSLTLPLFIAGGLQFVNDAAFCLIFRRVRPPEEIQGSTVERSSA